VNSDRSQVCYTYESTAVSMYIVTMGHVFSEPATQVLKSRDHSHLNLAQILRKYIYTLASTVTVTEPQAKNTSYVTDSEYRTSTYDVTSKY